MTDEDDRTTPIGLFNYADSYWHSAKALEKAEVRATHPDAPICFLFYHAIEIYLKAYLRAQKHSVKELRSQFGHNVVKLREQAQRLGLHFDDEDIEVLTLMGETDAVIRSRFLRTGSFQRPTNEVLNRTCRSVRKSVGEALTEKGIPVRL